MLPPLALVVYCCLVYWLFKKDREIRKLSSNALWIPSLLLAIIGSKPITLWLDQLGSSVKYDTGYIDQTVHIALVTAAFFVLTARNVKWLQFASSNKTLMLMYLFWVASCLWAPDGFAASKRLFRDSSCVIVGMIFLTEVDRWQAIRIVFVRLAYVILPLSIVLAKYFPALGRGYFRAGDVMYAGVAAHKNTMGVIALVFGLLVFADLLSLKGESRRVDRWIRYGILVSCFWILLLVDSATSLLCLFLGCWLFWGTSRLSMLKNPAQVLACSIAVILIAGICETAFGISTFLIEDLLGRETTLTGRTNIWADVRAAGTDPLFGAGFYSFWDTPAGKIIAAPWAGGLTTVHNGFLETYVDGGIAGVSLLIVLLLTWLAAGIRGTLTGTIGGQLTLVFWIIAIIYNNSETSFFRVEPLWFTLLLLTNQYRHAPETHRVFQRQSRDRRRIPARVARDGRARLRSRRLTFTASGAPKRFSNEF